mmetsp:Transcript_13469/g.16221  ORF Transcript_13469/g.16221 Transcript_13469/m.16221 type:complete len:189 (+) Transcript_13469:355-921(+)|eukprot:CAMPEP_0197851374 /NCGR_PEP_ID=MMETSP1438-20131217/17923_1 /TAXON_ID=1461541 /ORGANISM="Pterosperma sp., Strain CCMP1384" /LENGTH=188 /DNA_ID=CAMNT_0043464955 /DNA_START=351 /DNA_END=917 /DNA_ORIENTATION=+
MPGNGFAIFDVANTPCTNVFEAAERGDIHSIMKFSKQRRFDINQLDRFGRTPLMWAADCGHIDAVEHLLNLGADVEITDHHTGRTAMHWAARSGVLDIVKSLHKCGGNLHKVDNFGLNPLYLASQKGQACEEVFKYLIEEGAKYNEQHKDPEEAKRAAEAAAKAEQEALIEPALDDDADAAEGDAAEE